MPDPNLQRESFLEEIADKIHPLALEAIPQVYVVGSMGAGKSSLIHGIHNQLKYSNMGLRIDQRRKIPAGEVYDFKIKYRVKRNNATIFPETSTIYTHSTGGIIPIEMQVEGSHPKAEKLFARETVPNAVVFCLDLLLIANLLDKRTVMKRGEEWRTQKFVQPNYFKCEPNYLVFVSLLEALDHTAYWKELNVPVLAVGTQYQKVIDRAEKKDSDFNKRLSEKTWEDIFLEDEKIPGIIETEINTQAGLCSEVLSAISSNLLLELVQKIIRDVASGTEKVDSVTSVKTQAPPLPKLFSEVLLVDSRHPSRSGIEEAAYRIARAALPQFDDLRLVSLSHQVPDTERVVKYISLR